jgi:hypothetical protein
VFGRGDTPTTYINATFVTTALLLWYVQHLGSGKNNQVIAIQFLRRKLCFSSPIRPDQNQSPAILLFNVQWGFILWRETGRCLKLITDFHSVSQLRFSGVINPPSHKPLWWELGQICYCNLICLFKISVKIVEEIFSLLHRAFLSQFSQKNQQMH